MLSEQDSYSIKHIRVFATILIVLCHIFMCMRLYVDDSYRYLSLSLNVGVQIFLCISGYLYGCKMINGWPKWLFGRFKKIFVPYLILVMSVFLLDLVLGIIHSPGMYVEYLLGLSGLTWAGFPYGWLNSLLVHTWFITAICLCYLITPVLQRLKSQPLAAIMLLIMLYGGGYLIDIQFVRLIVSWVFLYSFCYYYAMLKEETKQTLMILVVLLFVLVLTQLSSSDYYQIFDSKTYQLSHDLGGLFFFLMGLCFISFFPQSKTGEQPNQFVRLIDKYSFSIYLVHYAILLVVFRTITNVWACIGISLVGIVVLSFLFEKIISIINTKFFKEKK